jgi:hypothetical protein
MVSRITVVHYPFTTADVANEDHDVMIPHGRHPCCRHRTRKVPYPIGSEIQLRTNLAENVARCLAATKFVRASSRPSSKDNAISIGIDAPARNTMRFEMMSSRLYVVIIAAAHIASDLLMAKVIITVMPVPCVSRRRDTAYKGHRDQSDFRIYQIFLIYSRRSVTADAQSPDEPN